MANSKVQAAPVAGTSGRDWERRISRSNEAMADAEKARTKAAKIRGRAARMIEALDQAATAIHWANAFGIPQAVTV